MKLTLLPQKNDAQSWFSFVAIRIVILYVLMLLLLVSCQRSMVFHPNEEKPTLAQYNATEIAHEVNVTTEDNLTLHGWAFDKPQGKYLMVYFHGNAGHFGGRTHDARMFNDLGYPVILTEYRGFGGNPGKPTEEGFYKDARAWISWAKETYPNKEIVLYGESLGTGVSSKMAAEYDLAGVILEVPFTSVTDVAQDRYWYFPVRLLVFDKFDTLSRIKQIEEPILIMGGEQDQVVPGEHARIIFDAANEPKTLYFEPRSDHFQIYDYDGLKYVRDFMQSLD